MMQNPLRSILAVVLSLACAAPALAQGAWTTYIRAFGMTDIEAGTDSVWFGTGNAGLLLYRRSTGEVTSITRSFGGLSSNAVSALALDRSRRLWVGTADGGVSRLSGTGRWSRVNAFDGLPSNTVTVLRAYGDTVWIGTSAGLAFWKGTEISGVLPDGVNPSPFASDAISGIAMMGDSVWVATAAGVYLGRMSEELRAWPEASENLSTTDVKGLAVAGSRLFAVAGSQVWVRDATQWSSFGGLGAVFRVSDDHGVVLASTDTGVWRWTGSAWTLESATPISTGSSLPQHVTAGAADELGRVSLANYGVLYPVDGSGTRATLVSPGPVGNNITNVVDDGTAIYAITRGQGIARLRDGVWTNWPAASLCDTCTVSPYGRSDMFTLVAGADGRKWFSTWSLAVEVLDDHAGSDQFTHLWIGDGYDYDRHTWGWSSVVDPSGGIWIGSDTPCSDCPVSEGKAPSGIDYYAPSGALASRYLRTYSRDSTDSDVVRDGLLGNQVRALAVDDRGFMWAGFGNSNGTAGVNSFRIPATPGGDLTAVNVLTFKYNTEDAHNVFGVVPYGDSIWVLSSDSLRCFRNYGSDANPITLAKPGPMVDSPHPLEVTLDGSVWVAGDGGVRVYHPGGRSEDFTIDDSPLAGSTVRSVRRGADGRIVWFVTTEGINRYDPAYVAPPPPTLSALHVKVWPNPLEVSALGGALRLSGEGTSYRGAVYAIDGRKVRSVSVDGNGAVVWDGRDDQGDVVRPGVYLLRVEAGGASATARFVVLR